MIRFRPHLIASILIVCSSVSAWSAPPIGRTTDVNKNAFADAIGSRRALELGSPVVAEETISTDKLGKAAFRFVDDTELSVGSNSTVKLDRFIYDPDTSVKSFVIRATKGMFRFVTGKLDHDSYVVGTYRSTGNKPVPFNTSYLRDSTSREMPLKKMLMPTSVPTTQAALDGHVLPIIAASTSVTIPSNSSHPFPGVV